MGSANDLDMLKLQAWITIQLYTQHHAGAMRVKPELLHRRRML